MNTSYRTGRLRLLAACGLATLAFAASAHAVVIYTPYSADAATPAPNPTSPDGGSWTASNTNPSGTNTGLTYGAGTEGSGAKYWNVTDTAGTTALGGTSANASINYTKTGGAFTDAIATTAWIANTQIKVTSSIGGTSTTNGVPQISAGTFFDVRNGHKIYALGVQNDSSGHKGLYWLPDGSNAAVGSGADNTSANFSTLIRSFDPGADYFSIKMVYTPNPSDPTHAAAVTATSSPYDGDIVSVYLNDELAPAFSFNAATSAASQAAYNNLILGRSTVYRENIGQAAQGSLQTVNYRSFGLETPEPATLAAIGIAGVGFVRRRRA